MDVYCINGIDVMPTHKKYCTYCGRVAYRCKCGSPDSNLQQFLARQSEYTAYIPQHRETPYKRGVPPQIKRRERNTMRRIFKTAYADLVANYGEMCLNCGAIDDLVIDHIISIAKGGRSEMANLQLLCPECNRLKGKLCIDCRP